MLVVLKSATNIDPLCRDLTRSTIEFDMKPVEEYTKPNITALMADVKEEFDRATLQSFKRKMQILISHFIYGPIHLITLFRLG